MFKIIVAFLICIFSMTNAAFTADLNKPEEAVAMVKKAITHYQKFGKEKTLAEVSKLKGPFVDKEMFTVVMDAKGVVLAHGFEHKMIGKNIMEMRDHEGTAMVQDMFRITKDKNSGWTHYKFPNPMTKAIEPKSTYVEKYDGLMFFCGIHTSKKP
jgi:cytochrome c